MTSRAPALLTNWYSWIHKALFITHSDTPAWWALISQLISHNRWWCTFFKPVHRNEKCWHILACFGQFWLWCRERTHFWRTFYRQWCDNKYQVCLICKSIATFWFVARRPLSPAWRAHCTTSEISGSKCAKYRWSWNTWCFDVCKFRVLWILF